MKSGYSLSIPFAMLFRKFYCHKCGTRLKRQKVTRTLNPGDPGYEAVKDRIFDNHEIVGKPGTVSVSEYVFACPVCHSTITLKEQESIAARQKGTSTNSSRSNPR